MLSSHLGIGGSEDSLALTGCVYVTDTEILGADDMTMPNSDGMWRYKIEVSGTGITEYYEYDERKSTDTVRDEWLSDVAESWSDGIASQFRGSVEVTPLWEKKKQESSEALALPPTMEDWEE